MRRRAIPILALAAVAGAGPGAAVDLLKLRHEATLYADAQEQPLRLPQGVACGEGNRFLVADSANGRILRAEASGAAVLVTGVYKVDEIEYPIRVAEIPGSGLFALDGKTARIGRLGGDGTFAGWFDVPGTEGAAPPVVRSLTATSGGNLLILDLAGARVVEMDPSGALRRALPLPAEVRGASDVAIQSGGTVFLLDGVGRKVWVARTGDTAFSPFSPSLAEDLDFPSAIALDNSGRVLVADENGGGIVILGPDGSFRGRQSGYGWRDGYLRYPSDLCVTGAGRIVVADRENQRVQVFQVGE